MSDDTNPQAAEAEGGKKKNGGSTTVGARLSPQELEAFDAAVRAAGSDRSAVTRRLLTWWLSNGGRFPDERENVAVVQTSVTSGAPSVVAESIADIVERRMAPHLSKLGAAVLAALPQPPDVGVLLSRIDASQRAVSAEALAVYLAARSYDRPLSLEEARNLVKVVFRD